MEVHKGHISGSRRGYLGSTLLGLSVVHCNLTFLLFCDMEVYKGHISESRRGYLGSTLLACRAVARPHIELEICRKHKYKNVNT